MGICVGDFSILRWPNGAASLLAYFVENAASSLDAYFCTREAKEQVLGEIGRRITAYRRVKEQGV